MKRHVLCRQGPPAYDHLHLNSCPANPLAAALRYAGIQEGRAAVPPPSRRFIDHNERVVSRLVGTNSPVSLRDGYRTVAELGVRPEPLRPYDVRRISY